MLKWRCVGPARVTQAKTGEKIIPAEEIICVKATRLGRERVLENGRGKKRAGPRPGT